jgi:hypothetical protein
MVSTRFFFSAIRRGLSPAAFNKKIKSSAHFHASFLLDY